MRHLTIPLMLVLILIGVPYTTSAWVIFKIVNQVSGGEIPDPTEKLEAVGNGMIAINPVIFAIEVAKEKSIEEVYDERLEMLESNALQIVKPIDNPATAYLLRARIDAAHEIVGNDAANIVALTQAPLMLVERLKHLPQAHMEYLISVFKDLDNVENAPGILLSTDFFFVNNWFEEEGKPIPKSMRKYLACHFSAETLDRARYVVNDDPTTLNGTINWLQTVLGSARNGNHAVVSDNLIVFAKMPKVNASNISFWAHEVAHTVQFAKWGQAGFAKRYMVNYKAIERAADTEAYNAYQKYVVTGKVGC